MATLNGDEVRSSSEMMEAITEFLEKYGGSITMAYEAPQWIVALVWGREAPDSPMAAGTAYGTDETAAAAVEMALREAGI